MLKKTSYIQKFKQLYLEIYNVTLSEELAIEYFEQILTLFTMVYKPLPEIDIK